MRQKNRNADLSRSDTLFKEYLELRRDVQNWKQVILGLEEKV